MKAANLSSTTTTVITQKDIADKLGISKIAVSYALRGSTNVSEKTRLRVVKAAQSMGYRLNTSARAIRTGKFGNIGLLLSQGATTSVIPETLLRALTKQLGLDGHHLMVGCFSDDELSNPSHAPSIISNHVIDAVFVYYTHQRPASMDSLLRQYKIPAIWLNTKRERNCIYHDDEKAGSLSTQSLIQKGYKNIIYANHSSTTYDVKEPHYSIIDREAGYRAAMAEAALKPKVLNTDQKLSAKEIYQCYLQLLKKTKLPCAIVTQTDHDLQSFSSAALSMGLALKKDFHIASIALATHHFAGEKIPGVSLDHKSFAIAAVEMLARRLNNPNKAQSPVKIMPVKISDDE